MFSLTFFFSYNKLSREIRSIADKLKELDENDPWRCVIPTKKSLLLASKVSASSFCRRRLPSLLVRSHMAEELKVAVTFIEQGHVRVGPDIIRDPAFLVTRY
ncbi:unnamed protein product [Protopolystoma xenopodis]|uniref:RNA-binding S4 domain-containing protein n=1 Tax=Protopolystoma xenopodis TaxID=117903 RepID=A0A448WSQ0_9PLAT|nr:unnamed protein product [Protopolystoma xenopodis]